MTHSKLIIELKDLNAKIAETNANLDRIEADFCKAVKAKLDEDLGANELPTREALKAVAEYINKDFKLVDRYHNRENYAEIIAQTQIVFKMDKGVAV